MLVDKSNYKNFCNKFLSTELFEEVKQNDNEKQLNKLIGILSSFKKQRLISEEKYRNFYSHTCRTPTIYVLPKTHKNDFENNLKFRPIISTYNSFGSELAAKISKMLSLKVMNILV